MAVRDTYSEAEGSSHLSVIQKNEGPSVDVWGFADGFRAHNVTSTSLSRHDSIQPWYVRLSGAHKTGVGRTTGTAAFGMAGSNLEV